MISIEGVVEMLLALCTRRYSEKERLLVITAWETELNGVPIDKIQIGMKKAIGSHNGYMTPPGKFRELCLSGAGCQSLEDEAHSAWALVMNNLNSWISPVFKDSLIAEAIRKMGGWKRLCLMLQTEEPFRKRDFIDLYLVAKRQNREFFPVLSGVCVDYKFIGYSKGDDLKKVALEIERKENADKRILAMVMTGIQKR